MRQREESGSIIDPDMRMLRNDELESVNGWVGGWAISFRAPNALPPDPCFLPPNPCLPPSPCFTH